MNRLELDTNLLQLLPEWYRKVVDYQQVCSTEEEQFTALAQFIHRCNENFYVQTMDEQAVRMWESIFEILPNLSTESLSFRRNRILNRISLKPPFTLAFLYQKLDELIGVNQWKCEIDYPNYTIYVESAASNQEYAIEAAYTIATSKPAHMVYRNVPLLRKGISITEEDVQLQRIYHYGLKYWRLGERSFATNEPRRFYKNKLGLWELGKLPFAYAPIRTYLYHLGSFLLGKDRFAKYIPEEVIKMESVPSIQPELLEDAAHFVISDISKVRVNGSVIVTSLEKTVSGTTAIIQYLVPDGIEVNTVELLDSNDQVLTRASVYVPSGINTVLKHEIPIKEGN